MPGVDLSQYGTVTKAPADLAQYGTVSTPDSAASRFGQGLYKQTIQPVAETVKHPIDTAAGMIRTALGTGDLDSIADQVKAGNYKNAALLVGNHLMTSPGDRIANAQLHPIFDDVQKGNYAGAAGQAVGLAAMNAGPAAMEGAGKGALAVADRVAPAAVDAAEASLRAKSEAQYARTLAPTTKGNKVRTADVVPGLIERGQTAGTLKGLQNTAAGHIQAMGDAIGTAWENLPPDAKIPAESITNALDKAAEAHYVDGSRGKVLMGPVAESAVKNIGQLKEVLESVAEKNPETGALEIPASRARQVRQYFDQVSQQAGRFEGKSLADQSAGAAHAEAADAIRGELAKQFPDIAVLNKEYSFWKDVHRVVTDTIERKTGQGKPLGVQLAEAGGFVKGGVLGKEAMGQLTQAMRSPAWQTVNAVAKDRLANALARGQRGPAEFYVSQIGAAITAGDAALKSGQGLPSGQPGAAPIQ